MKRALHRAILSAAAFFAASALAVPAASADTTADLGVTISGSAMVNDVAAKDISVTVTNHGQGAAAGFKLTFDTSQLDATRVSLELPDSTCDRPSKTCEFDVPTTKGEQFDIRGLRLVRAASAPLGAAGKLKATVASATADPNAANNSVSVDVKLLEPPGVDMTVLAQDLYAGTDDQNKVIALKPGESARIDGFFYNQGSYTAEGIRGTFILPAGATFTGNFEGMELCAFSDGNHKMVCTVEEARIHGFGSLENSGSHEIFPPLMVRVDSDLVGPVNLTGSILIEALGGQPSEPEISSVTPKTQSEGGNEPRDGDVTDNTDEFVVYVGATGNLPKTGPDVTLIAGIGAGVLVVGGALFVVARRRRVAATELE